MSEADIMAATPAPRTISSLVADLKLLGVSPGDTLLCHSSLRSIGWVAGGPAAVIDAITEVLGPTGTLVMPAQSGDLSDPAGWENPPVPKEWVATIRAEGRPFDPETTPTRGMGQIAELFRTWPSVLRSIHPTASFVANGPNATLVTSAQSLDDPLGESGPLGALYRLDAKVLLLGVDYSSCTALHLAERLADPNGAREPAGAAQIVDGQRRWVEFATPVLRDGDELQQVGSAFERATVIRMGRIGSAESRLLSLRAIVDYGVTTWKPAAR